MVISGAVNYCPQQNKPLFVNNDSAENGCGVEATVVGTAGGGNGAVNKGDDPNGAPGVVDDGGVGRFIAPVI
jgi:hypothetical protein